eukprot:scaffold85825_cov66-Phaeocystis_antarctica.AAC.2
MAARATATPRTRPGGLPLQAVHPLGHVREIVRRGDRQRAAGLRLELLHHRGELLLRQPRAGDEVGEGGAVADEDLLRPGLPRLLVSADGSAGLPEQDVGHSAEPAQLRPVSQVVGRRIFVDVIRRAHPPRRRVRCSGRI